MQAVMKSQENIWQGKQERISNDSYEKGKKVLLTQLVQIHLVVTQKVYCHHYPQAYFGKQLPSFRFQFGNI
jgi:hypothetical protein